MRIGIFGGSFNPPHQMHLEIGQEMISHGYVDRVIYVPTGKKYPKSELLEDEIRYQMVSLMTEDDSRLEVSDYELQNHLIYTYQTLDYFKEKYPNDEICFILGSDLYSSFSTWKNYPYILENYQILVVLRDDDSKEELEELYRDVTKNVLFTDVHPFVLSSTKVRDALREGNFTFVKKHLSTKVFDFIVERNLYQREEESFNC